MTKSLIMKSALIALICSISFALPAMADTATRIDVPAGELIAALQALEKQADVELVYQAEQLEGIQTAGLSGNYSAREAVSLLLKGTPLAVRTDEATGVMLIAPMAEVPAKTTGNAVADGFTRVAQAKETPASGSGSLEGSEDTKLEEIVVTAQKRVERLQDVPVPVTAIDASTLVARNQVRLQDYYASVPGLNLTSDLADRAYLSIRGITTGRFTGNPTVGVTLDDMSYGSSTSGGGGSLVAEIDPGILARIEVLRGPQGTLYGADSIGGLLKYVTVDPSMERLSGRLHADTNAVRNGDSLGYSLRGSANIPVSDAFAVQASGFTRRAPGYLDNVQTGEEGVNQGRFSGGRIAGLWRSSETFSLKLSALLQDSERDAVNRTDPGFGEFEQSALRGTGATDESLQAYQAILNAKLGAFDLVSLSGYSVNRYADDIDWSPFFGGFVESLFGPGITGAQQAQHVQTDKVTQELRLSASLGARVEWLLGLFYTNENTQFETDFKAIDPDTGAMSGLLFHQHIPRRFEEYAAFGNVTFQLTDRFDVQLGGRQAKIDQTYATTILSDFPVFAGGQPEEQSDESAFTYLVTPRFKIFPDLMVYSRLASGYRAGGVNGGICGAATYPCEYEPDKTRNYEVGIKGQLPNQALNFDASLYRIDWEDLQINLIQGFTQFTTNIGEARSQGLELSLGYRPWSGMTFAAWGAWNDAELTQTLPITGAIAGAAGERLPYSSRFSGNLSLDQEFALMADASGFAGASVSYIDERTGQFQIAGAPREKYPSYTKVDVRAGVRYGTWTAGLYVNNLTDRRGLTAIGLDTNPAGGIVFIQPRTIGLSLEKTFD